MKNSWSIGSLFFLALSMTSLLSMTAAHFAWHSLSPGAALSAQARLRILPLVLLAFALSFVMARVMSKMVQKACKLLTEHLGRLDFDTSPGDLSTDDFCIVEPEKIALACNDLVSKLRRTSMALLEREAVLQAVFDASEDAYLLISRETRSVIKMNARAGLMFGRDDVKDIDSIFKLISCQANDNQPNPFHGQSLLEALSQREGRSFCTLRVPGFPQVRAHAVWRPLNGTAKEQTLVILSDRTVEDLAARVRVRLEDRLRNAQHLEAVGKLAGGVAHHLHNSLQVILGFSNLVIQEMDEDDPRKSDLKEVSEAARQSIGVTRQLITFSRSQAEQEGSSELNTVIRDLEKVLRSYMGSRVDMEVILADEILEVGISRGGLELILTNLCLNARDAISDSGVLKIEGNRMARTATTRSPDGDGPLEFANITVTDTGCGMDAELQAQIFDPFFSTKDPTRYTGLGLSTTYGIVRQTGGWIDVSSSPGMGSSFVVHLPIIRDEGAEPEEMVEPSTSAPATLLLVDDNPAVQTLNRSILEEAGHAILMADCGEEALRILKERHGKVDLALVDVVMPGMGGQEFYEQVRMIYPELQLLFTTAYPEDDEHLRFLEGTDVDVLHKPYYPQELCRCVRNLLPSKA